MRKKNGSMLIELLGCILILSLSSVFIATTCLKCSRAYKKRVQEEKVNRIVNMVIKELKYNSSKSELDSIFNENNRFGFKYEESLIEELSHMNLNDLKKGKDIEIEKESEDKLSINYKIIVNVPGDNFNIENNYEFHKSWWMDEI